MEYMLFICTDLEPDADLEEYRRPTDDIEEWVAEMTRRGISKHGDRLRPAEEATTVRVRKGDTLITDGPFAETRERIGGYDIIECRDLDEAIEVASKHPMARFGRIEIRELWPLGED